MLPILAIETSGTLCSVALMVDEKNTTEFSIHKKHVHAEKILELVDNILSVNSIKINDIGSIAFSAGPGSFTGLRIGLAAAKGLAEGAEKPVIPVPTLDALALNISSYLTEDEKFIIANKVNITEVYKGCYTVKNGLPERSGEVEVVECSVADKNIKNYKYAFGSYVNKNGVKQISDPNSVDIVNWAYYFGKDLLTYNYDFLEPQYLKQFVIRSKK